MYGNPIQLSTLLLFRTCKTTTLTTTTTTHKTQAFFVNIHFASECPNLQYRSIYQKCYHFIIKIWFCQNQVDAFRYKNRRQFLGDQKAQIEKSCLEIWITSFEWLPHSATSTIYFDMHK